MKQKKPIIRTAVSSVFIAILLVLTIAVNIMLPTYNSIVSGFLGDTAQATLNYPDTYNDSLNLQYTSSSYTQEEMAEAEPALNQEIAGEGIVLLKNEGNMPYAKGTAFSFFGAASATMMGNTMYDMTVSMGFPADPGTTLKGCFEERGFQVNETLWNFYWDGNGKDYRLGSGSISWGDAEDFSINECPLDVMQGEGGLLDSAKGTVPVFVLSRKVGEGRDMPRSMYNHTDDPADQAKSYLEPDSNELAILEYLNDNYDDVVLLVYASAAMELGWAEQFENINAIVYSPNLGNTGMYALADIFSGDINPSGHTVDTFAYDAASAPAAVNYGDYQYSNADGSMTKYNYVYYQEGIYIGYRYFETRYEDAVMGQGNAGDYDYASTVLYPFGYGLSYTTFDWSNFKTSWSGDTCTVSVDVKNTGSVAGKEVVQVYVQSPYTDYDKKNLVEKSAVDLVGFGKTALLQPGQSETVTVEFDKEQLKAYDSNGAKTYILDAGDYYITAAHDAHEAVNNVLAAKGYTTADGMTEDGDTAMVDTWNNPSLDTSAYANDTATGVAITNQFDFATGGITYLSRSDWQGTWPQPQGEPSSQISTWGNEINGSDGKSYTYTKTITAEELAKLDSFDSLNPVDSASITDTPVYGAKNGHQLIELRGRSFDDPLWDELLDQITPEEYQAVITQSGYGNPAVESIDKPFSVDLDAANGLMSYMGGGTGYSYQAAMVLAQTWNKPLAERYGEMIGNQSFFGSANAAGWYAPAMNMHRLPFSGRNAEYYSEDAFLSGTVAAATSRGAASKGMYIFIKHFALNDQENHRGDRDGQFSIATFSNEQAIREIYLKPFEMCIKNDPIELNYLEPDGDGYKNATTQWAPITAIMSSFNRIGYTWAGGCYPLMTSVLRDEWGFHGFAVTDNANTGLFMDAYQMIEAGGDGKLTNQPESARWTFDKNNSAHYHYARQAMKNVLYAVVNSKTMNGLMPGAEYIAPMTIATKIQIAVTVVAVVIIVLLAGVIFFGWRKYLKQVKDSQV